MFQSSTGWRWNGTEWAPPAGYPLAEPSDPQIDVVGRSCGWPARLAAAPGMFAGIAFDADRPEAECEEWEPYGGLELYDRQVTRRDQITRWTSSVFLFAFGLLLVVGNLTGLVTSFPVLGLGIATTGLLLGRGDGSHTLHAKHLIPILAVLVAATLFGGQRSYASDSSPTGGTAQYGP